MLWAMIIGWQATGPSCGASIAIAWQKGEITMGEANFTNVNEYRFPKEYQNFSRTSFWLASVGVLLQDAP